MKVDLLPHLENVLFSFLLSEHFFAADRTRVLLDEEVLTLPKVCLLSGASHSKVTLAACDRSEEARRDTGISSARLAWDESELDGDSLGHCWYSGSFWARLSSSHSEGVRVNLFSGTWRPEGLLIV